jgi:hypothetical protein
MISDHGTDGISHTIHVASNDDGELSNFREFENVLDVMNLPNGSLKFYFENNQKIIESGKIVRSTVRGIENAFRYRCRECKVQDTDVISQSDRGDSMRLDCHVCGTETEYLKREMNDL